MCMTFTHGQKDLHQKGNCLKSGIEAEKELGLKTKHITDTLHLNPEVHPPQVIQNKISMTNNIQNIDQNIGHLINCHIVLHLMRVTKLGPQITAKANLVDKVHQKTGINITKRTVRNNINPNKMTTADIHPDRRQETKIHLPKHINATIARNKVILKKDQLRIWTIVEKVCHDPIREREQLMPLNKCQYGQVVH